MEETGKNSVKPRRCQAMRLRNIPTWLKSGYNRFPGLRHANEEAESISRAKP